MSCELTALTVGACLQEMVGTVQRIMDNGHAYSADGDVYFDVGSLPGYGRLSGRAQVGSPGMCWHCGSDEAQACCMPSASVGKEACHAVLLLCTSRQHFNLCQRVGGERWPTGGQ